MHLTVKLLEKTGIPPPEKVSTTPIKAPAQSQVAAETKWDRSTRRTLASCFGAVEIGSEGADIEAGGTRPLKPLRARLSRAPIAFRIYRRGINDPLGLWIDLQKWGINPLYNFDYIVPPI